jgi:hypothetical protein
VAGVGLEVELAAVVDRDDARRGVDLEASQALVLGQAVAGILAGVRIVREGRDPPNVPVVAFSATVSPAAFVSLTAPIGSFTLAR